MGRISITAGKLIWSFFLHLGRKSTGMRKQATNANGHKCASLVSPVFNPDFETIVLLHGFTGFKEYWSDFIRSCTGRFNFVAIDLPGHGESGFDQEDTFQRQALVLIHDTMSRNDLKSAHFVGASVGAWIACLFALEKPSYVKTLTLIGPVGVPATSSSEFYQRVDEGRNPFWISTRQEYTYLLGLALKSPPPQFWPLSDFLLADYIRRQPIYKMIWEEITDRHQHVRPLDLAKLSELPCSKFLIMGDDERTIHHSVIEVLEVQVEGIGVHKCPGSGHSVQCDQPKWLARIIDAEVVRCS